MFLEKLTALVSPLFTGFCHPKTSYDAFLNPASSSSYYPISVSLNPVALSQSSLDSTTTLDSAVGDFLLETVSPVGFQAPLSFHRARGSIGLKYKTKSTKVTCDKISIHHP